jgi:hypothetical protein
MSAGIIIVCRSTQVYGISWHRIDLQTKYNDNLALLHRSTMDTYILSSTQMLSSFLVALGIACETNNSVYKNLVL